MNFKWKTIEKILMNFAINNQNTKPIKIKTVDLLKIPVEFELGYPFVIDSHFTDKTIL